MEKRYLEDFIIADALKAHKIAFISGPRQVGKTTMAKSILARLNHGSNEGLSEYFNWDDDEFRKEWAKSPRSLLEKRKVKCIGLDEIHKDRRWKNKLKGLYDLFGDKTQFLVTGSARLDYFRKSGDSLQGRYFPYRLHPFTFAEAPRLKPPPEEDWLEFATEGITTLPELERLSGFPEPLWQQSEEKARRWRRLYRERMIREDARDIQNVREIHALDTLSLLLQDRAANQLSYQALREGIGGSHDTITRWIEILETLYYCYRIRPYFKNVRYSLKKEPKIFLYDWGLCESPGARWENMIAGHLLKNVHLWTDAAMGEFELHYLRDKQKREVDFLVTKNKKPWLMVETKTQRSEVSPSLIHFQHLLKPRFCFQVVKPGNRERARTVANPDITVIGADRFLRALN